MFEGEKRKEVKQSLEESVKGTLLFYTRHTSRNKMEDKQEIADYRVKKESVVGHEHDSAPHKALEKHIKPNISYTSTHGTHAYPGGNGVDESTKMRFFCNDLQLA